MIEVLDNIINCLRDFNIYSIIVRLFLATFLSAFIGFERSRMGRAAGLRTHILVCLGATIASMTGLYLQEYTNADVDVTRIAAQIVSGIGFLGAGTILIKNKSIVTGLTTAACVWATGTIGIAIGYGFYEAAIIGTILILFINGKLNNIDKKIRKDVLEVNAYIEFIDARHVNDTLEEIKNKGYVIESINFVKSKVNQPNSIASDMILHINKKEKVETVIKNINKIENINFGVNI